MKQRLFYIIFAVTLLAVSCAKRGMPSGGPKDETAPYLVSASPNNETVNFDSKKVRINFNKYVKLQDLFNQLIISPPMENMPEITPVGSATKFINIKINDTLAKNTTYIFNFGNSVVGNNEGNILHDFKYVFSTGNYIDSLTVSGNVVDAFDRETEKNVSVLLYEVNNKFTDSIIYKENPKYISNTLDSTYFQFTNLKAGKYVMVALKGGSQNSYKFNPKTMKIGFVSEPVTIPTDTMYTIKLFKEELPLQVYKPKEEYQGKLDFGYEGNADSLQIDVISEVPSDFTYFITKEKEKDTLNYWFKPYEGIDSLSFNVHKKEYAEDFTVKLRTKKIDSLNVTNNVTRDLHLKDTFNISANIPLISVDTTKIQLFEKDSVEVTQKNIYLSKDKINLYIDFKKKQNENYKIDFLPGALKDFFEETNDTLQYRFQTKSIADYGNLFLDIEGVEKYPIIVQLLDENDNVLQTILSDKMETIKFDQLEQNSYALRIIIDENKNGKWDTGSFLNKEQPEEVFYYNSKIKIRPNADIFEKVILK
ncbi:Ig-like domain-containing protein [Aureivirga marina]|uniref:Ig-like domain-containing protein n=1 Tax=Aureivirga marina TaxID=1182451 RepID=UPI0018CA80ED|nr:Ig-like domain-containing protein [Aureivirga marina]